MDDLEALRLSEIVIAASNRAISLANELISSTREQVASSEERIRHSRVLLGRQPVPRYQPFDSLHRLQHEVGQSRRGLSRTSLYNS